MKIDEIKDKAKKLGVKVLPKMKKADLVRSIQSSEGNLPCYQTGILSSCTQAQCCWREDCL